MYLYSTLPCVCRCWSVGGVGWGVICFTLSFFFQALYRMHQGKTTFKAEKEAAAVISRAWRNGRATAGVSKSKRLSPIVNNG